MNFELVQPPSFWGLQEAPQTWGRSEKNVRGRCQRKSSGNIKQILRKDLGVKVEPEFLRRDSGDQEEHRLGSLSPSVVIEAQKWTSATRPLVRHGPSLNPQWPGPAVLNPSKILRIPRRSCYRMSLTVTALVKIAKMQKMKMKFRRRRALCIQNKCNFMDTYSFSSNGSLTKLTTAATSKKRKFNLWFPVTKIM